VQALFKSKNLYFSAFILVFLVALFHNIGLTALTADEPTRTVVAMELDYNDNLFVSTLNGVYYYNKLPIYNWIILGLYKITDSKAEWVSRLPTVLSLIAFCVVIFQWSKKYLGNQSAFLAAIIFATCSRILFYDSMLGLIDMFFGLLIFISFICVYEFHKKERLALLFVSTYSIMSVCFLMKGLQAIAFQGMTLLGWFIFQKQFKKLFGWQHFLGIGTSLGVISLFFFFYTQTNSLDELVSTLWSESSKRTVGKSSSWVNDLIHLLTFPVKNVLLDILPWGAIFFFLFNKGIRQQFIKQPLVSFSLIILGANIIVYWLSPETRGRYLFPHYGLLSILMSILITKTEVHTKLGWLLKVSNKITLGLFICSILALVLFYFLPEFNLELLSKIKQTPNFYSGIWIAFIIALLTLGLSKSTHTTATLSFVLVLIGSRALFNSFIIPSRLVTERTEFYKSESLRLAHSYNSKPLKIVEYTPINHGMSHYIMVEQDRLIPRIKLEDIQPNEFYLVDKNLSENAGLTIIDQFTIEWGDRTMYVAECID